MVPPGQSYSGDVDQDDLSYYQSRSKIFGIKYGEHSQTDQEESDLDEEIPTVPTGRENGKDEFRSSLLEIDGIGESSADDIQEVATSETELVDYLEGEEETPLSDRVEAVLRNAYDLN